MNDSQSSAGTVEPGVHGVRPASPPAEDLVEEQLAAMWGEVLELPFIDHRDNIFDVGATSLDVARVAARIKKVFGRELRLKVLMEVPTIEQLAGILRKEPVLQSSVVVPIRIFGSRPPVFLLPGAAGHLVALREFWLHLPDDQPVYGIEPKLMSEEKLGRDTSGGRDGAPAPPRVEEIAAAYVKDITDLQPSGPYYLVGLCFGGLVAFELARQLASRGDQVGFLALLDSPLPGARQHRLAASDVPSIMERFFRRNWTQRWQIVRTLAGGTVERFQARWQALLLRVSAPASLLQRRALNVYAGMHYAPEPCSVPFTLLVAADNGPRRNSDQEQVWRALGPSGVSVETVPGGHGTFFREPHSSIVAQALMRHMEKAQQVFGGPPTS